MNKEEKTKRLNKIITWIVFSSLVISAIYAIFKLIYADPGGIADIPHEKLKSDYTLMLIQCILGIVLMFFPDLLTKHFKITIPNKMYIMFIMFLYAAIVLGEVRNFYYIFPHWDTILHMFSGGMLGAVGFSVVDILNENKNISIHLTPKFVAIFAFCFALALGSIWEIYEFTGDSLLGLNMQKYALEDGTKLIGQQALADTMGDLIVDAVGALTVTLIGYSTIRKKKEETIAKG